jgi:hypothetical protein
MVNRYVLGIVIALMLALGALSLAQQERASGKPLAGEGGQFKITSVGDTAVLLDSKSGTSWVLHHSADGDTVWLPAKRIDSEQETVGWRKREESLKTATALSSRFTYRVPFEIGFTEFQDGGRITSDKSMSKSRALCRTVSGWAPVSSRIR